MRLKCLTYPPTAYNIDIKLFFDHVPETEFTTHFLKKDLIFANIAKLKTYFFALYNRKFGCRPLHNQA